MTTWSRCLGIGVLTLTLTSLVGSSWADDGDDPEKQPPRRQEGEKRRRIRVLVEGQDDGEWRALTAQVDALARECLRRASGLRDHARDLEDQANTLADRARVLQALVQRLRSSTPPSTRRFRLEVPERERQGEPYRLFRLIPRGDQPAPPDRPQTPRGQRTPPRSDRAVPAPQPAPTTGFLGVQYAELPADHPARGQVDGGVLVSGVIADTAAERAGLQPGDVIVAVGDRRLKGVEDLAQAMGQRQPGSKVGLRVLRDGWTRTLQVTLGKRPADLQPQRDTPAQPQRRQRRPDSPRRLF